MDSPEEVLARLLAFQRKDEPGLVGPRERKLAHTLCDHLRQAGWRIIRQPQIKRKSSKA